MNKNPKGYKKLTNGDWDFDVMMDMVFSFFTIKKVPASHPKVCHRAPRTHRIRARTRAHALAPAVYMQAELLLQAGIAYTCSCPRFMHYYYCKHIIAFGLEQKKARPAPAPGDAATCPPPHPDPAPRPRLRRSACRRSTTWSL